MPSKRTDERSGRVLILQMPLATPEFPGLGPTLIYTILREAGIDCDIEYANLRLSRLTAGDAFLEKQLSKLAVSEMLFTHHYFDTAPEDTVDYLTRYLDGIVARPRPGRALRIRALMDQASALLDELMATIDWSRYAVVGFSCMMQQTVASLALARRIRVAHPHIRIVFGGPSVFRPMGEEMMRQFPEIDVVVDGEADAVVVPLMQTLLEGARLDAVPGILFRDEQGGLVNTGDGAPFDALDRLPIPDYGSFYAQLEANGLTHVQPYLTLETSRGCWWGQKSHCTFCGIGDDVMRFRSKSEARVMEEVLTLSAASGITDFFVVDSIINIRFVRSLLPKLAELRSKEGFDFSFFFETKSNLRRDQIRIMRDAGITALQPGIEAIDTDILKLMRKGSTAARQVQCLKLLAECEIVANWNLIFKLPLEQVESYHNTCAAVPFLHHLPPLHGEGMIPMLLNRYAPYHENPDAFGVRNIRPLRWFDRVFPRQGLDGRTMAFYFDYDCDTFDDPSLKAAHADLYAAIRLWQDSWTDLTLVQRRGPGFVRIDDRRALPDGQGGVAAPRDRRTVLRGVDAEIFSEMDEVTTLAVLQQRFAARAAPAHVEALVDALIAELLVFRSSEGELIALPLLLESRLPVTVPGHGAPPVSAPTAMSEAR